MSTSRFIGIAQINQDERNVLILSPYIQTKPNALSREIDFENSLIADLDSVSSNVSDQIMRMIQSEESNSYKLLLEYLSVKTLTNNERALYWLQNAGVIQRVPASSVRLTAALGGMPLNELNKMIKGQMEDKENSSIDVEEERRRVAQQYNQALAEHVDTPPKQQLDESITPPSKYPDFGNPSERGDVKLSELDTTILNKYGGIEPLETTEGKLGDTLAPEPTTEAKPMVTEEFDANTIKELHGGILSEIEKTNTLVTDAMNVVSTLDDALSSKVVGRMLTKMKNYGSTSREGVKEVLIELLSQHYDNVDAEYIRRNLKIADTRLANDSKDKKAKKD